MMLKNSKSAKLFFILTASSLLIQPSSYAQETTAQTKKEKKYTGSLDLGADFANGNSKEQSIQSNLSFNYKFNKDISNKLRARAGNTETNNVRTEERYYINNQTRKNLTQDSFTFLELEYVSDRYGGYNYRASETIGLGKTFINNDKFKLTIQSSAGLRQTKLTTDEKNNNFMMKAASNFEAILNESLSIEENLDISSDEIATITRSDTNLKILVSKELYLKFGVLIQHVSSVPEGSKNSDVITALKIGYQF